VNCPRCQRPVPSYALFCPSCGQRLRPYPGHQRWVAVVFIDLSDFTRFTTLEGSERAFREVKNAARVVTESIAPFGGEVQNIAGDGFLAVFGLKPSRPDLLSRALRGAEAALRTLEASGLKLTARAALTAGLVYRAKVEGREQLFGDPINLASRILTVTPPGTLVLDARLGPLVPEALLEPLPPLSAKGVSGQVPLATYRGLGAPRDTTWNAPLLERLAPRFDQKPGWVRIHGPAASGHLGMLLTLRNRCQGRWISFPPLRPGVKLRRWFLLALEKSPELKRHAQAAFAPPRTLDKILKGQVTVPLKQVYKGLIQALEAVTRELGPVTLVLPEFTHAPTVLRAFLRQVVKNTRIPVSFVTLERTPVATGGLYPLPLEAVPETYRHLYPASEGLEEVLRHLILDAGDAGYAGALQPYLDRAGDVASGILKLSTLLPEGLEPDAIAAIFKAEPDALITSLQQGGLLVSEGERVRPALDAYARGIRALTSATEARQLAAAYGRWLETHGRTRAAFSLYLEQGLEGAALRLGRGLYRQTRDPSLLKTLLPLARQHGQEAALRLDEAHALKESEPRQALAILETIEVPAALKLRGTLYLKLGEPQAAVQNLVRYLEHRPQDTDAWEMLLPHLNPIQLLELRPLLPDDPLLRFKLAWRLEEAGALEAATAELKNILSYLPQELSFDAVLLLSGSLWRQSRPEEAGHFARRLPQLARTPEEAALAEAVLGAHALDVGDLETAQRYLEPLKEKLLEIRAGPECIRAEAIRLRYLMETGRLPEAYADGLAVIEALPHPWLIANTALAAALLGQREDAHQLVQRALETKDSVHTEIFALIARGVATCCTGRQEEERGLYRRALFLAQKHKNPYALYFTVSALGLFYLHKNPKKTESTAHFLTHRGKREGFYPFYQLGMLLRAQVRRDRKEGPIRHLIERMESPYPLLEYWRRKLLAEEDVPVKPMSPEALAGYGILGRMMLNVWSE